MPHITNQLATLMGDFSIGEDKTQIIFTNIIN
jgi:hypothetical protein